MSVPSGFRVIVVTSQRPFPTFHGANADAGRLILALRTADCTLMLVSWCDVISEDSGLEVINSLVDQYIENMMVAVRPEKEWRVAGFAQSRRLTDERRAQIVSDARRFAPDLVLSIGLYGASLGIHIADLLGVPHVYRSQAIEHEYYAELFSIERQSTSRSVVRRAKRWVRDEFRRRAIAHLEEVVLGSSDVVLEISAEDAEIRRSRSRVSIEHLPPCAPEAADPVTGDRPIDVLYLGNLFMGNNRIGLTWFLGEVLPILRLARPRLRIVVAGKSTDPAFEQSLRETGVVVLPNVADAFKLLRSAKVAVNPIFVGNGTNVKTIDALWCGCGVVTTAVGVQGYDFKGGLNLRVAHLPVEFASAVVQLLDRWPSTDPEAQRDRLRPYSIAVQGQRLARIFSGLNPLVPAGG